MFTPKFQVNRCSATIIIAFISYCIYQNLLPITICGSASNPYLDASANGIIYVKRDLQ